MTRKSSHRRVVGGSRERLESSPEKLRRRLVNGQTQWSMHTGRFVFEKLIALAAGQQPTCFLARSVHREKAAVKTAAATTATPFDSFTSQQELEALATSWPKERLVAIWNSLAGVRPQARARFYGRRGALRSSDPRVSPIGRCSSP